MGISYHPLNFLKYSKIKNGQFNKTLFIGRQTLRTTEEDIRKIVEDVKYTKDEQFCEKLIHKYFGANLVESLDNSDFQGAKYVHDMNKKIPISLENKYDTVIDSGTLEHIYNVPQALMNCSLMCRDGGQIIHILPTNNYCGHGFWQVSPELFFSLYSEKHGYKNTEIFLSKTKDRKSWYSVTKPLPGRRINILSSSGLYLLVRTVRNGEIDHENVQQSDYEHSWNGNFGSGRRMDSAGLKAWVRKKQLIYKVASKIYNLVITPTKKLTMMNKQLNKCKILDLTTIKL
jgi:hypothetical protein